MHLVLRLKVASDYVLQRRDHVDCEIVDHERPSEVGNDHVFVDPSFGGSGDGSIDLFHPGRELFRRSFMISCSFSVAEILRPTYLNKESLR